MWLGALYKYPIGICISMTLDECIYTMRKLSILREGRGPCVNLSDPKFPWWIYQKHSFCMSDGTCAECLACPASVIASRTASLSYLATLWKDDDGILLREQYLQLWPHTPALASLPQSSWRMRSQSSCLPKSLSAGPTHITFTL